MLDLEIKPVTPELHDDVMRYFDLVAYADNPAWSKCYCMEKLVEGFEDRTKEQNRALRADLVRSGRARGLVAYRLHRVVGWCHAAPKRELLNLEGGGKAEDVGAIVCFVVAPDSRRQGIATALLVAACDYLRELGMREAEAYPWTESPDDASRWVQIQYVGPLSMYLKNGFERVRQAAQTTIVRRRL
ncbi:hypothetical protein BH18CHL2_BH18CHL2_04530 [soil metagenome]